MKYRFLKDDITDSEVIIGLEHISIVNFFEVEYSSEKHYYIYEIVLDNNRKIASVYKDKKEFISDVTHLIEILNENDAIYGISQIETRKIAYYPFINFEKK